MELRHCSDLAAKPHTFKRLAREEQGGETEETEEAHDIGYGGDEHR
jgi:hypothetical protein